MTGQELYNHLIPIYSSPHDDTHNEMMHAVELLNAAMKKGYPAHVIISKMKQKAKQKIDFKSKLHTAIINQFWVKDYSDTMIPYLKFNKEDI